MRTLAALIALFFLVPVASLARDDSPGSGLKRHALTPIASIDLPKKWVPRGFPMPMVGASNHRIDTGDMRVAITGFPLPAPDATQATPLPDVMSEAFVRETVKAGSAQYASLAKDPAAEPVVQADAHRTFGYMTFDSASGKPAFMAFPGRVYRCVTSGMITTKAMVFTVTIGSDDCEGKAHRQAMSALSTLRTD